MIVLSISGAVFQNTAFGNLSKVLNGMGFSEQNIMSAVVGSQSGLFEKLSEEVRQKAVEGIVKAIGNTYVLIIAGSALALVTSVFFRRERLFMEMSTGGA